LQFDRVAEASGSNSVEELAKEKAGGVGVVLSALVGASIPVIVRHGDTDAQVALRNLAFQAAGADNGAAVSFDILREGNRSVYGDISVTFTPRLGVSQDLIKAAGVAVYTPNPLRKARMPLTLPPGLLLSGGTLKISYRERAEAGGKLLAESALVLP
jgi:hypothetical protein